MHPREAPMHSRAGIYCCDCLASVITLRRPGDAWTVPPGLLTMLQFCSLPVTLPRLGGQMFLLLASAAEQVCPESTSKRAEGFSHVLVFEVNQGPDGGLVPSDLLR